MTFHRFAAVVAALGLGGLVTVFTTGSTQAGLFQQQPNDAAAAQPGDQQQDMEVQARGPIHEAFAEPVGNKPQATPVVPKQPPDPIDEVPPDQKPAGQDAQWIPGYWSWDEDRNDFIWVSGVWRVNPPDRSWVPGHWAQGQGGWQWTPGFWMQAQAEEQQAADSVEYLPPPPAALQTSVPPAPDDQSVYVPGNWVYRETRYRWRPGFWLGHRPGWVWIPAHYVWTPVGYVFVEGYWDLELEQRGLCFAPVWFRRPLWTDAGWFYRPQYLVYDDFIRSALFVRPGFSSYYFGDYFEPAYRQRGFISWLDFRLGGAGFDPLFSYYRWSHRDNPGWYRDMRDLYTGRFEGRVQRPPRTLVQQNTMIQNITVNNVNNVNVTNITAVAPLTNVNRNVVKLQRVPQQDLVREQRFAQTLRQASVQRSQVETQLLGRGGTATATSRPVVAQVNVPKPRAIPNGTGNLRPPPSPVQSTTGPVRPEGGREPRTGPGTGKAEPMPERRPRVEPPQPERRPPTRVEPPVQPERRPPTRVEPPQPERKPPTRVEPPPQERRPPTKAEPPQPERRPPARVEPPPERKRPQPPERMPPTAAEPRPQPPARVEAPREQPRPQPRPEPRPEPRPQPRAEPARPMPPAHPPAPPPKPERPPDHKRDGSDK